MQIQNFLQFLSSANKDIFTVYTDTSDVNDAYI